MNVYSNMRGKYKGKQASNNSGSECLLCNCKIIKKQESKKLKNDSWTVLANWYPHYNGNLLIITNRHLTKISELTNKEWTDFIVLLNLTLSKLSSIFKTESFNIGLNQGRLSGGTIDHLHWQIIPRDKIKIPNSLNIFADLHSVSMHPKDLLKLIDGS